MKLYELDILDKSFINKSAYKLFDTDAHQKAIDIIKKDCSEILQAIFKSRRFLFRGFKSNSHNNMNYFKVLPRQNRIPRDTDVEIHQLINDYLKDNGFEARRDNSLFCISSERDTLLYGKPYIVFPKDGFKYTWANIDSYEIVAKDQGTWDLFTFNSIDSLRTYVLYGPDKNLSSYISNNKETLEKFGYLFNESIMIKWDKLQKDLLNPKVKNSVVGKIRISIDSYIKNIRPKILDNFNFNNTSIEKAMSGMKEIYILGECYCFDVKEFEQVFINEFFK